MAWLGETDLTADQLLTGPAAAAPAEPLPRDRAADLLRQALAAGPRPAEDVIAELEGHGLSRRTVFRARAEAGVQSQEERTETVRRAVWRLEAGE